ncbi:hypothetical protein MTO96_031414 [Rhipicephalus appendiculatus]
MSAPAIDRGSWQREWVRLRGWVPPALEGPSGHSSDGDLPGPSQEMAAHADDPSLDWRVWLNGGMSQPVTGTGAPGSDLGEGGVVTATPLMTTPVLQPQLPTATGRAPSGPRRATTFGPDLTRATRSGDKQAAAAKVPTDASTSAASVAEIAVVANAPASGLPL